MRICIEPPENLAKISIMYSLGTGEKITTYTDFREAVRKYILEYGWSRADDHYAEYIKYESEAQEKVNHYY